MSNGHFHFNNSFDSHPHSSGSPLAEFVTTHLDRTGDVDRFMVRTCFWRKQVRAITCSRPLCSTRLILNHSSVWSRVPETNSVELLFTTKQRSVLLNLIYIFNICHVICLLMVNVYQFDIIMQQCLTNIERVHPKKENKSVSRTLLP